VNDEDLRGGESRELPSASVRRDNAGGARFRGPIARDGGNRKGGEARAFRVHGTDVDDRAAPRRAGRPEPCAFGSTGQTSTIEPASTAEIVALTATRDEQNRQ